VARTSAGASTSLPGGATAMDTPFFQEIDVSNKLRTNLSLSVQLGWFEEHKLSLCSSPKSPSLHIALLSFQYSIGFCIWDFDQTKEDIVQ